MKEQEQKISAKIDQLLQRARTEWRKEGIPSQEMKEREIDEYWREFRDDVYILPLLSKVYHGT